MSDGAFGLSWNAATAVAAPERPALKADLDVDVCVIGGGLAGLTAAREIAKRGWSVAVLEATTIGAGASGRNTGFVIPGFGAGFDEIVERIGLDAAKALWALSESGVDYVRETIADTAMPGVEIVDGWLNVSKLDDDDDFVRYVALLGENGIAVEGWTAERVRDVLKSESYFHAIYYPRAFHIHPLNYALGLARAAEAAGVRIFEGTPALSIDAAGVRKRIATPDGRVRAAQVVLAGNTDLHRLMPRAAATVVPITTYVVTTAPLGERLTDAISYRGGVSDTQWADNHYRIVGGDRLMWSGGLTAWQIHPRHFVRRLRADIARTFPQIGKVAIDYAWSGTLGRTVHKMPQIGEIARGVWMLGGFGGHGLNTTAMAGQLVARGMVEGDETWRQFAPFDLVWAGGTPGRVFGQASYWVNRPLALGRERLARRREQVRHRRAEQLRKSQDQAARDAEEAALATVTEGLPSAAENSAATRSKEPSAG